MSNQHESDLVSQQALIEGDTVSLSDPSDSGYEDPVELE